MEHTSPGSQMSARGQRKHNKSQLVGLSVLEHKDEEMHEWYLGLQSRTRPIADGLCEGSPCLSPLAGDGRYSHCGKKVAYAYQIVAFEEFGREALEGIESSKGQHSMLLSHTCGTRNCCTRGHMVIESKAANDERTHCHYAMRNILKASGRNGVGEFLRLGGCPHRPQCGSVRTQ